MSNTKSALDVSVVVESNDDYSYRVDVLTSQGHEDHACLLNYIENGTTEWMAFASTDEMEAVARAMLRAVAASKV